MKTGSDEWYAMVRSIHERMSSSEPCVLACARLNAAVDAIPVRSRTELGTALKDYADAIRSWNPVQASVFVGASAILGTDRWEL